MSPPRFAIVLVLTIVAANPAAAQETRAGRLRQAREEKQQALAPYEPGVLETALKTFETGGVPLVTTDGIYIRLGSLTTGSGFAYGGGYRTSRLGDREAGLDLWAGMSRTAYWAAEARVRLPRLAGGRALAEGYARRHEYPQEAYFGLGPASRRRDQADYRLAHTVVGWRAGLRPASIVTIGGGLEYLQPRIGRGTDDDLPGLDQLFDDRSAPGVRRQPDFVRSSAFLDVDWRRPLNARNGGWYRVEYSRYTDRELGAHTFSRLDVDFRQFVSFLAERRVLMGRVLASTSDQGSGQSVPFYLMPTLGGHDSLRGFRPYRFRGPHALLVQGEYRFEIWSGLDGALFTDAGKVAMRRADLDFTRLESDYGFGFRFNTDNGIVARVDAAFGSRDGRHLWIVFGGTF
jgi:hypothetical protein